MKFFQKVNMMSEAGGKANAMNRTGLYQASGSNAAVDAGAFVILGALASSEVYNTFTGGSAKDWNKFICTAPTAVTNKGVYVVDPVKVSDGTINGNVYRMGDKTLGLGANSGEPVALRRLDMSDQFLLGADNFVSAPTVGQYAILTAGSTVLTGSAGVPASGFCVAIDQTVTLSQGITANGSGYLVHVVQL